MTFTDTPDFVAPKGQGQTQDNAIPKFTVEAVRNNFRSDKEGRPVFDNCEFVEIMVPGDRRTVWKGRVREQDRQRWPQHYERFKKQQEEPVEGTPIDQWAAIGPAQAEELKFANIRTVEVLAGLPDDALNRSVSMGGFALREKARRFVAQAEGAAPMEKLAAENADLKANMALMKSQMADLQKHVDALRAAGATTLPGAPA